MGPVGPTWVGLCSQKLRPVKVKHSAVVRSIILCVGCFFYLSQVGRNLLMGNWLLLPKEGSRLHMVELHLPVELVCNVGISTKCCQDAFRCHRFFNIICSTGDIGFFHLI